MKKRLFALWLTCFISITLCFSFTECISQSLLLGNEKTKVEVGINIGPSFFLGDLGGNRGKGTTFIKDVNMEFTQLVKGVFVAVYPNDWLGFRFTAQTGSLKAED